MNWPEWVSPDGRVRLINADCAEVLSTFAPGEFDACVTDPPYGIGVGGEWGSSNKGKVTDYGKCEWDNKPASEEIIDSCRRVSRWQVIFGGNYFHLPPSRCWLVWNKLNTGDFADCELAWTNLDKAVRKIDFRWNGMLRDEPGERVHPTQKPVEVMRWAIGHCPDRATILDPFGGSCTTAVACIRSVCIERERQYWLKGIERCEREYARTALFDHAEARS
jgi:DNA modification methylase